MCGIAGKITFARGDDVEREVVADMTAALAHRGPDGSGFRFASGMGFGYRRLNASVGRGERQPAGSYDETVWAMLDGEIHNARDLRLELERRGRIFHTKSAVEVVVQGYEQWGDQIVSRLRGPFAVALWDGRQQRLLLARDRLGIRPLHYALIEARSLSFASEIKALLHDPAVPRHWNAAAITEYMALGWIPSPATMFSRIVKLPAGHLLIAWHGRVRVTGYWDLSFDEDARAQRAGGERQYVEDLDRRLRDTIARHAHSEASLGTLVASGLGSATVASYVADASPAPIVTTCTGFDAPPLDEVQRARLLARHVKACHHTELVTPDVAGLLPRLAWHFDEPFGDPSAVTTHYTATAARAHAQVAIAPFGTDEVWSAGVRHRREDREARARGWLGPLRFGAGLVAPLLPIPASAIASARLLALSPAEAYARKHAQLAPGSRIFRRLYADGFVQLAGGNDGLATLRTLHEQCASSAALDRALYVDVKAYLEGNLLTRLDRASAAHGLVLRLPMLDHELVEFAANVPPDLRVRSHEAGYLLRQVLEARVPARLLRPSRHPFEPAAAAWLRGPLAPMVSDLLLSGRFRQRGIFDHRTVRDAWQAHLTGRRDHHRELWSMLMLELWFEQYIDQGSRRQRAA